MEFRAQDIAQLVLGYLRDSKSKKAFGEFLNTCVHLREHAVSYQKRQYFITRVSGLSLVDYLHEYALIYTIVQERLEASEYFKENKCPTSLAKQLLYLLDKLEIHSRTSTPINQENNINENFFQEDSIISNSNNVISTPENVLDNGSIDKITNRLSGSSSSHILNGSVRESSLVTSKSKTILRVDKSVSTEDETDPKEKSHEKCEEIFTNTFLENVELIEKLADNINKEVSSKSNVELDSTAIDSIVQRTEADPIFVQLINELIEASDEDKRIDEGVSELDKSTSSDKQKEFPPSKKNSAVSNETNIKLRLRSSKPQTANQSDNITIDTQNDDAIQSICMHAASKTNEDETPSNPTMLSTELVLSTEQSINITQSLCNTPSTQNTFFTSTGSLLMLQPNASVPTPNILSSKTLTVDASKSCYVIGNQPFVNVSVPPTPLKLPNVLSEQDILSMPTIFVCDTSQQLANSQALALTTNANVLTTPRYQNIAPKQTPEKVQSLSEYITLYKCSDTILSPRILSPAKIQPKQTPLNKNQLPSILENTYTPTEIEVIKHAKNNENNSETAPLTSATETPLLIVVEKKDKVNRTTPKGSSHIRQLDFSTPDKWVSSPSETSAKTKKAVNAKSIRTTLFKSPNTEEIEKEEQKNDEVKKTLGLKTTLEVPKSKILEPSWDANLRGFQVSKSPVKKSKDKQNKRKREDSVKQVFSAKKLKESSTKADDEISKSQTNDQENGNERLPLPNSNVIDNDKQNKPVDKRLEKSTSKKKPDVEKKTKKKVNETTNDRDASGLKPTVPEEDKADLSKNDSNVFEKSFQVINRNMNPKVRKKCNADSSKKTPTIDEVILTNVPKIKSLEVLDDNKSTVILSPSKLNANKRSLVEIENCTTIEQSTTKTSIDFNTSTNSENKNCSVPEEFVDPPPKMNSLPLLQTPVKIDIIQVPKTPGINTSVSVDTPFTKAVIDQLNGVDLNSIPTPRFPITPNFALTPALAYSPFSNRGTDYSTSSSYYQPSDTEQNKSLEQLIQECQRLEKQEIFSTSHEKKIIVESEKLDETEHSATSLETVLHAGSSTNNKGNELNDKLENVPNKTDETIHKMLVEKQNAFNQSLSGKKNMQLVKMLSEAALNGSDSDSISTKEDSSSSDNDSCSSDDSGTITPSKDNKSSPYSLRPRKTPTSNDSKEEKVNTNKSSQSKSPDPVKLNDKSVVSHKADVLQKMEIIRQRTIAKFKENAPEIRHDSVSKVKNLTKLRKGAKVSAEKITKVRKSNSKEPSTSSDIKVTENHSTMHTKKLPTSTNLITKSKKSETKICNKSKENLKAKEKLKPQNKKLPKKVKTFAKGIKYTKGISENKTNIEIKSIPNDSTKSLNKEVVTMAVEEEDIVLHLSSDDENLEPFEMVETELLECSTSFTLSENVKEDAIVGTIKEECNEKNLDKEAETLVKGLKQWGIHLIPNKSVKNKTTPDVKEAKDVKLDKNKIPSGSKQTLVDEKNVLNESETKEDKTVQDEIKKTKVSPPKDESKSSEGESREAKIACKKSNARSKNDKKEINSKKSKTVDQKQKLKIPEVSKINKSSSEGKEKKITKSIERKSSLEEIKRRYSLDREKVNKEPNFQVNFDTKTYEEENIKIQYDYSVPPTRKISDYNFDILTKTFSANVFIEEINSEVEKFLSFSRFKFLLDISPKSSHKRVERVRITKENSLIKKKKPLDILYNELINEPVDIHTPSPLQNLYAGTCSKEKSIVRKSISTLSDKSDRNIRHRRSISIDKCGTSKGEQNLLDNTKTATLEKTDVQGEMRQNRSVEIDYELESNSVLDSENDLMNYALIGSERVENNDEIVGSVPDKRKRKSTDEIVETNQEDKKKKTEECQELLRNIDVDSFLKQLHGDT